MQFVLLFFCVEECTRITFLRALLQLSKEQKVQVCDATGDAQRFAAGNIKKKIKKVFCETNFQLTRLLRYLKNLEECVRR